MSDKVTKQRKTYTQESTQNETKQPVSEATKVQNDRTVNFCPDEVLYALSKTYPDEFPFPDEVLNEITGGVVVGVKMTRNRVGKDKS